MKLKTLVIGGSGLFLMVFSLLLFVAILFSDEQDSGISNIHYGGVNVSAEVLAHKPMVEKYAKEYGVEEYVNILLAIIQVESGGTAEDVMQSSESLGLPPNSLSTEESIKQGVKYFSELLASSERLSVDLESVIQSATIKRSSRGSSTVNVSPALIFQCFVHDGLYRIIIKLCCDKILRYQLHIKHIAIVVSPAPIDRYGYGIGVRHFFAT